MLTRLVSKIRRQKSLNDYKQEAILKQGKEQIKKLIDRGIELPVVLL